MGIMCQNQATKISPYTTKIPKLTANVVNDLPSPQYSTCQLEAHSATIATLSSSTVTAASKLTKVVRPCPLRQPQQLPRSGTQQTRGKGEHTNQPAGGKIPTMQAQ